MKTRLILKSFQSPGDVVMLTASVRDLHKAYPGQYEIDVRTSAPDLWENNPHLVSLDEKDPKVRCIDMHYPLIHESNQRPFHFIHGYIQFLESQLGVRIPVTDFRGDIHLSLAERHPPETIAGIAIPRRYWVVVAGGKFDFTAKWWNPKSYQQVVDHFSPDVSFVQCGEAGHWHPPLQGATNLVGKTSLRELIWLIHHADGVLCPVTLAMHLAAAVEPPADRRWKIRPCVVVAGGREPPNWEAYPGHRHLSTVGTLSCCADGGCWKSRCQLVGDGDTKDRTNRCEQPVAISDTLAIPRCMEMITAEDVIRNMSLYLNGDLGIGEVVASSPKLSINPQHKRDSAPKSEPPAKRRFCLSVAGRPEELVSLGVVVNHLRHYFPQCEINIIGSPTAETWKNLLGIPSCSEQAAIAPQVHHLNGAGEPVVAAGMSNTQATRWLLDQLHLSPIEDLSRVRLQPSQVEMPGLPETLTRLLNGQQAGRKLPIIVWLEKSRLPEDSIATTLEKLASQDQEGIVLRLRVSETSRAEVAVQLPSSDGTVQEQTVALDCMSQILSLLEQADVVLCRDSPLCSLPLAVQTPTVCLWEKAMPWNVVEPYPCAVHLVSGTESEASPALKNRYRARVTDSPADDLWKAVQECVHLTSNANQPEVMEESPMSVREPDPVATLQAEPTPVPNPPEDLPEPQVPEQTYTTVSFFHGLGDAANFARLIPLYVRRGHRIGVHCTPDKEILFRAAGATIVDSAEYEHPWGYPPVDVSTAHDAEHEGHKAAWNISQHPLPNIGEKEQLWPEYCASQVRVSSLVPVKEREFVRAWLAQLPRPITLLHTKGNTAQSVKSLPDTVTSQFYREFLDRAEGSLVLLDWDNRVPRLSTYRVRHLQDMSGGCSAERMFALMEEADLMIGVDSGPLHAAGLTDTPRVGIWMPGHYPARYTLPDARQLNLVLDGKTHAWNRFRRVPWNIVEQPGSQWDAAWLAQQAVRMLAPKAYLSNIQAGVDVQLQHWVRTLCAGDRRKISETYTDRNCSFDKLLREATRRFSQPMFVETGTIRAEEDWAGAGFSSYLFGLYLKHRGGTLHSVDLSPSNCQFASTWTRVYGDTVHVHQQDSVTFLKQFQHPIDVLYLDSLDTTEPRHAEHALHETLAALPRLHDRSLILFDDTPWRDGAFVGKGARAVPWLLDHGWKILFAGYQVLLEREKS